MAKSHKIGRWSWAWVPPVRTSWFATFTSGEEKMERVPVAWTKDFRAAESMLTVHRQNAAEVTALMAQPSFVVATASRPASGEAKVEYITGIFEAAGVSVDGNSINAKVLRRIA